MRVFALTAPDADRSTATEAGYVFGGYVPQWKFKQVQLQQFEWRLDLDTQVVALR